MTLSGLQRDFKDAVLGAAGDALAAHIAPGLAARVAVYRNTVQGSLAEVIAAAFPVTQRIVGAAFFAALARRFAVAQPPRLPQLSSYGAGFPGFIAQDPHHGLAYLADVARLEWARGESYFAADAPALAPATIAALAPGAIDAAVLVLHPATRLIRSPFPVMRIWRVNQPDVADVPPVDMAVAENVLVSRSAGLVRLRAISGGDAAFISAAQEGMSLGAAVARGHDTEPGFDLETALRDHLTGGTFGALTSL
jgi:hypothetical protein